MATNSEKTTLTEDAEVLSCSVCQIHVTKLSELRQHLIGQKHKKAYRLLEEQQRINKKCGVFVKGFTPTSKLEDLLDYFQTFGTIVWVNMRVGFLLIDFDKPECVEKVLNGEHFIQGKRLFIQRRTYREPRVQNEEDEDNFLNQLKDIEGDLPSQMKLFKSHLQIGEKSNHQKYHKVYLDLHSTISDHYPYCQVHLFGSTMTGLSFKNSDVDAYVSGVTQQGSPVKYLHTLRDILYRSGKFSNTIVIAHAKIPIIKCLHKETHTNCDINLKNMLGVCNSNLIKYYADLNENIKNLMVVLKYWAKMHKITGQNHLFTNYSLCIMVIFFMQQKPYSLPSVLCLQKDGRFHHWQECWNGGFKKVSLYSSTVETLRKTSFIQILTNFFNFYSNFDYADSVICPFIGKSLKKDLFKHPNALPHYYNSYTHYIKIEGNQGLKTDACICMQDPFEHSRNTTSVILNSVLERFINFCILGKKICEEGESNLFYKLFTEDLLTQKKIDQVSITNDSNSLILTMKTNTKYLESKVQTHDENTDKTNAKKEVWFETVAQFMKIVLKDFFCFEIHDDNDDELPAKNMKANSQTNVHDNRTVRWRCLGNLNVWDNRKTKLQECQGKNFVEKEIAVTQTIRKNCGFTPTISIIEFNCFLKFCENPVTAKVNITKISCYKNIFKNFSNFFIPNVQTWFVQYEEMLNST